MQIFLGDEVTVSKEVGGETTYITGRISGLVQKDNGDLRCFYIRGIDTSFWMSEGWKFQDEFTIEEGEEE